MGWAIRVWSLKAYLTSETASWAGLVKELGVKPQERF